MKTKKFLSAIAAAALVCLSTIASAQTASPAPTNDAAAVAPNTVKGQHHPRRKEVNERLKNQNERIDKKVANGTMSKAEAHKLKKNDHEIRQEEKDMAKQNGGHITKQEQRTLNQQENKNSRKIRKG